MTYLEDFKELDADGDGELDREELAVYLSKLLDRTPTTNERNQFWKEADLNNDGKIQVHEFIRVVYGKDFGVYLQYPKPGKSVYLAF